MFKKHTAAFISSLFLSGLYLSVSVNVFFEEKVDHDLFYVINHDDYKVDILWQLG